VTTKDFVEKAKKIHGNKYDYSLVEYRNSTTPVRIICPTHGEFLKKPNNHLQGGGCQKCSGKYKPTLEEFIEKANKVHNDKYNYSKSIYINNFSPLKIICPKHGEFLQKPSGHLNGAGCPKCSHNSGRGNNSTTEEFIEKANKLYNNKYDYSKVVYKNSTTPITIICPIHGEFLQKPNTHLTRIIGCPKCAGHDKTTEEFVKQAKKIHGNKYDYSKVDYKSALNKIIIICSLHGEFLQKATSHLSGNGCPKCRESKGERTISLWLEKNNIVYETQKIFSECKHKKPLRFDFYIPSKNFLIEYQGLQHFECKGNPRWKENEKQFKNLQLRDFIKKQWALENNFNFLEITYKDNIEEKLMENLLQSPTQLHFNNYEEEKNILTKEQIQEKITLSKNAVEKYYTDDKIDYIWKNRPKFEELKNIVHLELIRKFHFNSFYKTKVKGFKYTVIEAWDNEKLFKKCILNRLVHNNDLKNYPIEERIKYLTYAQIFSGFNISKIAPFASIFAEGKATKIIKELSKYDLIIDPFSGFSGRMVGALNNNKKYFGFDINEKHIKESNEIIKFLKKENEAKVIQEDLFDVDINNPKVFENSTLFTCSPYQDTEDWGNKNQKILSCDQWIDEVLKRYKCNQYLFVVDKTEKYKSNTTSEKLTSSLDGKTSQFFRGGKALIVQLT
jgi:hypothetical protein